MVYQRLTQERFQTFHQQHPDIYDEFKNLAYDLYFAREARGDSTERFGCAFVFSIMRYHHLISGKQWTKVQGNYQTRYAGMLVYEDKRFSQFFAWWVQFEESSDEKS